MGRGSQKIPALNFNRANGKHFQELAASLVKPIDLVTNHPSPPTLESCPPPRAGGRINAQTLFSRCARSPLFHLYLPSFLFLSFFLPSFPSFLFSPSSSLFSPLVARFFAAKALNRATIKTAPVANFRRTAIFRCRNVEKEFMATVTQPGHCELKLAPRQMDEQKKRVVAVFSRLWWKKGRGREKEGCSCT